MSDSWPKSSGEISKLLNAKDYQLVNLIRLQKVIPPLSMGRRAWMPSHVLAAAKLLGKDSPTLRNFLRATTSEVKPR